MAVAYGTLKEKQGEAVRRFGTVFDLPVIRSPYDFLKETYSGGRVLEVGAGTHYPVRTLLSLDDATYHSLDTDESASFTYRDVTSIPHGELYQWMVLNQIVEHITIDETAGLLSGLGEHLADAGSMYITVPNTAHPVRHRADPTHVTPWNYSYLYAICVMCGLRVDAIYRYSKGRGPLDPLSWLVERINRRLYGIDWCQSIMLVAGK